MWSEVKRIEVINQQLLEYLITNQFELVFISNQYLVSEQFITNAQFEEIDMQFKDYLNSLGASGYTVKYALANRADDDYYTKPNSGMIIEYMFENQISKITI